MYFSYKLNTQQSPLRLFLSAAFSTILTLASFSAQATVTTGSMTIPRMFHQANSLADGRTLLSGGYAKPGTAPYASVEIYDPSTGLFSAVAPMQQARVEHAAVSLQDGRILVMGGSIVTNPSLVGTNTAEIYDPATGLWSFTGNMNIARSRAIAVVLPNGKVLVMNKDGYSGTPYAEVYDPQTGIFSKTGNMVEVSGWHGLVALNDGRVLKVGGYTSQYSNHAEIWDPQTNQWSATGSMREARQDFRPVLLPDGKVLVAGGSNTMVALNTTEIYDPANGVFTAGNPMPESLKVDSSTVLPNGDIVLTGPYTKSLMHYQTSTGLWNVSGPRRATIREASISRLSSGNLLLAGGAALNDATTYAAVWDQACAPQKIMLSGATQNVAGNGGEVSFNVTAAPGCHFEASDMPSWLTLNGTPSLQMPSAGNMTVSFTAAPNTAGASRTASFLLGNNAASVTQAMSPSCPTAPVLSPSSFIFNAAASTGIINVSAAASCPWNVSSLPSWVTATSTPSATGNGSFSYSVAANTGPARSGTGQLDFLGNSQTFTMTQDAQSSCPSAPTLSPSNLSLTSSASTGTITVTAAATCTWHISSVPAWVTLTGASSGTGSGSFTYSVAANSGSARSGSGLLEGQGVASTFIFNQAASCALWSISPSSISLPSAGASGNLTVTAGLGCNWNLSGLPTWMSLNSGTSGSGNGTIPYVAASNTTGLARNATLQLSGSGPTLSVGVSQSNSAGTTCITPINSGVPINGYLQSTLCGPGARGSSYYTDRYTFSSLPGTPVTILLTSRTFDTYVYLKNPSGVVIYSNDDGGGGTNSRIPAVSGSFTLPAGVSGVYTIEVSSYYSGASGAYTLSLTK